MNKNADEVITDSLQRYRVTPHGTTGEAPSMLVFGRRIRTRLDLLVPSEPVRGAPGQASNLA